MNDWISNRGSQQGEQAHEMPTSDSNYTTSQDNMNPQKNRTMVVKCDVDMLAMDDPDHPQNWPFLKKVHASAVAFMFTFTLLFGATGITAGVMPLQKQFGISMAKSILPFSVYIFGIATAPLYTPHVSDRVGRTPVYVVSSIGLAAFIIGAGASNSITALLATRFFAGFCGGPIVVTIEGTYADVWPASHTGTYYSVLTAAQYIGAAMGPIIGGYVVTDESWRWTQWIAAIAVLVSLLLAVGVPETLPREIIRKRARRLGVKHELPKPASGTGFVEMSTLTVVHPLLMLVSEPLVIMLAFYSMLNFGVLFQWFISVPIALAGYSFSLERTGLAFITAIGGVLAGGAVVAVSEQLTFMRGFSKSATGFLPRTQGGGSNMLANIEFRMIPAILGSLFAIASLFWVGNTVGVKPFQTPVVGTAFFVWGSALQLIASISYLFDAYPAQGTLSALTTVAVGRVILAGVIPLVITPMLMNLMPKWTFNTFGFIEVAFLPIPLIVVVFGRRLRGASRYAAKGDMSAMMQQKEARMEMREGGQQGQA
ncbi:MAG: hypothetical protein M1828_004554 [Chrysothrix sp. TS-e1954]|nr:MAG: hypothetical protein M1828_004554 [Chrysothrix sp. TS-e1954]